MPNTWDELAEVVARLNGTDTNGDRRPDFALCADTIGFFNFILLTQIMASVTQTKGESRSVPIEASRRRSVGPCGPGPAW